MKRLEKLTQYASQDFHGKKLWSRLNAEEIDIIFSFLIKSESLDYNEFAAAVNRMFLDNGGWKKTKHSGEIQEILSSVRKTIPGFYGYTGEESKWIHPLDRVGEKKCDG